MKIWIDLIHILVPHHFYIPDPEEKLTHHRHHQKEESIMYLTWQMQ